MIYVLLDDDIVDAVYEGPSGLDLGEIAKSINEPLREKYEQRPQWKGFSDGGQEQEYHEWNEKATAWHKQYYQERLEHYKTFGGATSLDAALKWVLVNKHSLVQKEFQSL